METVVDNDQETFRKLGNGASGIITASKIHRVSGDFSNGQKTGNDYNSSIMGKFIISLNLRDAQI